MKKIAIAALLAASFGVAQASVITFEGAGDSTPIASGYGGLDWSNFYALDVSAHSVYDHSGYQTDLVSGSYVGFNAAGGPASISALSASGFDLTDAYFAGAWNNGLTIAVTAIFENGTTASKSFQVSTTAATDEFFNWTDVASVRFVSSGGTPQPGLLGAGTQFAVDNLDTTPASVVPEPANAALLMAGIGLLGLAARRRRSV